MTGWWFVWASLIKSYYYLSGRRPRGVSSGPEDIYYQSLPSARKEFWPGSNKKQRTSSARPEKKNNLKKCASVRE